MRRENILSFIGLREHCDDFRSRTLSLTVTLRKAQQVFLSVGEIKDIARRTAAFLTRIHFSVFSRKLRGKKI